MNGVKLSKRERKYLITGVLFALPGIIYLFGFNVIPILQSAYYSLCKYSVLQPPEFIGIENYKNLLLRDPNFLKAIYNTIYMVVIATPIGLVFSLFLAMLLNMKVKAISVYRTIFYLPVLVPYVATAILWKWILNAEHGILNYVLGLVGIPGPIWLHDPVWTKPALIVMTVWGAGARMIIYLAALQGVPENLYDAAKIDGAGALKKFWNITIPFISPVTLFLLIMSVIDYFQYFTHIYIFTGGGGNSMIPKYGPENSLLFYACYIYNKAFLEFDMGYASALAWVLFVIVGIFTVIIFKSSLKWVYYDGGDKK